MYTTPKIFCVEFENSWRSGVRSFTFTSVGASCKSTCCRFKLFLESYPVYLWRRIFGVRFTRIPPWHIPGLPRFRVCPPHFLERIVALDCSKLRMSDEKVQRPKIFLLLLCITDRHWDSYRVCISRWKDRK